MLEDELIEKLRCKETIVEYNNSHYLKCMNKDELFYTVANHIHPDLIIVLKFISPKYGLMMYIDYDKIYLISPKNNIILVSLEKITSYKNLIEYLEKSLRLIINEFIDIDKSKVSNIIRIKLNNNHHEPNKDDCKKYNLNDLTDRELKCNIELIMKAVFLPVKNFRFIYNNKDDLLYIYINEKYLCCSSCNMIGENIASVDGLYGKLAKNVFVYDDNYSSGVECEIYIK